MLKLGTVKNSKPFFSRKWITSYNDTSFAANDVNTGELTEQWLQMLDSYAAPRWNLIKEQIFKLLAFDIIMGGHSKNAFNVEGDSGNENENEQKWIGEGCSSLSLHSLYEKNSLIFQTANRVLSDKLLGSC